MHITAVKNLNEHNCNVCSCQGGCLGRTLVQDPSFYQRWTHSGKILRKGEHIFRAGEHTEAFFVVRSGSVKSYMTSEDGEEQVLGFYLPGDIFGLDANEHEARLTSAVAMETSSVCRFPHNQLSKQAVGANLLKISVAQIQRDHNLLLTLARKDADGRIASLLVDLAIRHEVMGYSGKAYLLPMSRQDIGSYLGLAVETVSRVFTRFQEAGVLKVNRREVEITDHHSLRRIAGARLELTGARRVVELALV
ncbi:MAG: cyclic nucleotide-binding domain-containing protein [Pseudomonadota bacterium]